MKFFHKKSSHLLTASFVGDTGPDNYRDEPVTLPT